MQNSKDNKKHQSIKGKGLTTTVLVGSSGTLHLGPSSNNSQPNPPLLSFHLQLQEQGIVAGIQPRHGACRPSPGHVGVYGQAPNIPDEP